MEKFTRAGVRTVQSELAAALGPVAARLGLKLDLGDPRYNSDSIRFTLDVLPADAEDRERREFRQLAPSYGLADRDYRREFLYDGRPYRLLGFNPNAVKYPIKAELVSTGTAYRLPPAAFRGLLSPEAYDARWGYSRLRPIGNIGV